MQLGNFLKLAVKPSKTLEQKFLSESNFAVKTTRSGNQYSSAMSDNEDEPVNSGNKTVLQPKQGQSEPSTQAVLNQGQKEPRAKTAAVAGKSGKAFGAQGQSVPLANPARDQRQVEQ